MTDYGVTLVKLTTAISQYHDLVRMLKFEAAADVAVDIQMLSNDLRLWAKQKCIEIRNS
jgi:hypothetical protein